MVAYYSPLGPGAIGWFLFFLFELLTGLAICLFALWRGRGDVRIVAGLIVASVVAGQFLLDRLDLQDPQGRHFWIDVPQTVIFVWMAVRSGAAWMIVMAALELLCLVTEVVHHYAQALIEPYTYVSLIDLWSGSACLLLLLVTLTTMRQAKAEATAQRA